MKNIIEKAEEKKLKKLYEVLNEDLIDLAKKSNITSRGLNDYFIPEMKLEKSKQEGQNYLYRLASSLQNSGMMHNSIRFNEDENRKKNIKKVLCNWNIKKARENYNSAEEIYKKIKEICGENFDKGSGTKKETNWQKYCTGLFNGLEYLDKNGIKEIDELVSFDYSASFEEFAEKIKKIEKITKTIHGLGLTLTCDWLKECGCEWLAKPDVHIIEVIKYFKNVDKIKDKDVLEFMFEWSKLVDCSPYKLDKMIWLLCTGNFYLNKPKTSRSNILSRIDIIKSSEK